MAEKPVLTHANQLTFLEVILITSRGTGMQSCRS